MKALKFYVFLTIGSLGLLNSSEAQLPKKYNAVIHDHLLSGKPIRKTENKLYSGQDEKHLKQKIDSGQYYQLYTSELDSMGNQTRYTSSYDGKTNIYKKEYRYQNGQLIFRREFGRFSNSIIEYQFDSLGRVLEKIQAKEDGSHPYRITRKTTQHYDGAGRLHLITDSLFSSSKVKQSTRYFDTLGLESLRIDKESFFGFAPKWHKIKSMTFEKDSINCFHWVYRYGDFKGQQIEGTFTHFNSNKQITKIETYRYKWGGNEGTELLDSTLSNFSKREYDRMGRLVRSESILGIRSRYRYDSQDNLTEYEFTNSLGMKKNVFFDYDSENRLIRRRTKLNNEITQIEEFLDLDHHNNWTKKRSYTKGKPSRNMTIRKIEYYDHY